MGDLLCYERDGVVAGIRHWTTLNRFLQSTKIERMYKNNDDIKFMTKFIATIHESSTRQLAIHALCFLQFSCPVDKVNRQWLSRV